MTTQPPDKPHDELLERYAEAVAQDPRRPSDRVRNAARAHAQMLRDQAAELKRAEGPVPTKTAANQPQWTRSLVASLAVVGLAGLLYVQIDRGNPQDRAIALGTAAPEVAPSPPPASLPTPTTAPQPAPAAARADTAPVVTAKASPPPPPPTTRAAPTPAITPPARQQQAVAAAAPAEADAVPSAKAVGQSAEQLASAGAVANDARREAPRAESRVSMAPAAPAAAAIPSPTRDAAPATGATARTMTAQFLAAAREGDTVALQELLAQGVAINTRDANGNTALMVAIRHRQAAAVRKLLDQGADTALVNKEGLTALRLAQQLGYMDMAQLLHPR